MRRKHSLQDAVVVITGASSGIGKAAALAFAEQRANLALAARRGDALQETAQACREHGVEAIAIPADVANADEVETLAREVVSRFGHFDVWVNNAGILVLGSLEQTPPDAYRRLIDINFLGYVAGARAALRHFRERGRGVLINNASLFSIVPTGYTNAYTASKQAVAGLTDALRQELVTAPDIHVVKILPAGVDSPILHHAANYTGRRIRPLYPLISPERVARVMVARAKRPRRVAIVGTTGRIQAALYQLSPSMNEWVYGRVAATALNKADSIPDRGGSLFEPVDEGTATTGGLRSRSRGWRVLVASFLGLIGTAALRRLARAK